VRGRTNGTVVVPRIVSPIRRLHPVEVRDAAFLRVNTDRTIKITLPGPFTMSRQAKNEFYKDEEALVRDYAAAVNAELRDLKAAGADVIQLDEPWLQARAKRRDASRCRRSTVHSRASPDRPRCTSVSATPMSPATSPTAMRFCPSSGLRRSTRSRSKPPSRISISPPSTASATRP
jgi:Cobalamin-independent synthase, Catalytic domain